METAENALETDAALAAPEGLAVQELADDPSGRLLLLSFPLRAGDGQSAALSPAERAISSDLLLGLRNREIARRRNVSVRTVANQVAGLFRKFGVHSRLELALVLAFETAGHEVEPACPNARTG